jgi:hypothetical protein
MIDLLVLQKYSDLIAIAVVWLALVLYPYLSKDLNVDIKDLLK